MEAKIAILFIGKKSRTTRHRELPIYLRVTVDKKRFEVATHQHIDPSQWSPSGRVKGKSDNAIELTSDHIKIDDHGKQWLIKPRQKTGIPEIVPMFPPALNILRKYENDHQVTHTKKLPPVPSNQKVNAYIKELGDICGISTKITFHVARHTFATTVTLDNGIPIDSVSKMLGHRSIKTTQIYAKVSTKR